jgi:hypothetical protein
MCAMNIPYKNAAMRFVNIGLYFAGCFLAGTGWLLAERLPRGREGRSLSFLGLDRHEWGEWHEWVAYGVIGLVVIHLLLNWQWLVIIASSKKSWRLWSGLLAGAALVMVFVALPVKGS